MKKILLILLVVITTSFLINLQMIPVIIAHRVYRFQYHDILVYYMESVFYFINIKQDGKPAIKQETLIKGITSVNHDHYHGITKADLMMTPDDSLIILHCSPMELRKWTPDMYTGGWVSCPGVDACYIVYLIE